MPLDLTFLVPGNYTITDNGIPGDDTSVIKDGSGAVVFTLVNPGDSIILKAGVAGISFTVDFTDSLGSTTFTIGDLTNSVNSPDSITVRHIETAGAVTLVANQTINEGATDTAADIIAGSVVLSAGTGVGVGNAIETQTSGLEAETTTGGISLTNFGSVQIGNLSDQVNGLDVATSGNIKLTAYGSISFVDTDLDNGNPPGPPLQAVHGGATSGNVTLTALGYSSDITAVANLDAITVPGGNIVLTAGRDVALGTFNTDHDNDVRASGSISVTAGRDFLIDGFSDLSSDDFGTNTGGNATINAGRDIHLLNVAGTDASVGASGSGGGDVSLITGAGGRILLDAPGTGAVFSTSGNVTLTTDSVLISGSSGITASTGEVDLKTATDGKGFVLGSASDLGLAVELSDAELDRIYSPTLSIGTSKSGPITTLGNISPANVQDLSLHSATDILLSNTVTVLSDLILRAGQDVILGASSTVSAAGFDAIVDWLTTDASTGGIGQLLGSLSATTILLSGGNYADNLHGTEGPDQTVHGNGGNDTITSSGEGHYYGDAGNDTMFAGLTGSGPEVLDGGTGIDTLDTTSFGSAYTIDMTTGVTNYGGESFLHFENLTTAEGNDILTGNSSNNVINSGAGNDTVVGAAGNDTLNGGDGDDNLKGSSGADTIDGGANNDVIDGGANKDTLTGGSGSDVFVFKTGETITPRASADVINDFVQGQDTIDLSAMDANTTVGANQAFTFIGSAVFSHAAGELHYVQNGGHTYVEGDTNGDGAADFSINLVGTIAMAGTDFVL